MLHTIWTALTMKLPLVLLALAVWWAIHEEPEEPGKKDDDGGIRRPGQRSHPLKPDPAPAAPRSPWRAVAAVSASDPDRPRPRPHVRPLAEGSEQGLRRPAAIRPRCQTPQG